MSHSSMRPSNLALALRRIATQIDRSSNPSRESVVRDLRRLLAHISASISLPQKAIEREGEQILQGVFETCNPIFKSISENSIIPDDSVKKLSKCLKTILGFKFYPGSFMEKIQDKCSTSWSILINAIDLMYDEGISLDEIKEAVNEPALNLLALTNELSFGTGTGGNAKILKLPHSIN